MQAQEAAADHGGATGTAEGSKLDASRLGGTALETSGSRTTVASSTVPETKKSRSPCSTTATNSNKNEADNDRSSNCPNKYPAKVSGFPGQPTPDTPDLNGYGNAGPGSREGKTNSNGVRTGAVHQSPPQAGCAQPQDESQRGLSRLATPESDGLGGTLYGLREGPVRDVLAALLTSTVMTEDGRRVLMPSFPSVSALRELKYCAPLGPLQASALERALLARWAQAQQEYRSNCRTTTTKKIAVCFCGRSTFCRKENLLLLWESYLHTACRYAES